jgi:hypothetical protein
VTVKDQSASRGRFEFRFSGRGQVAISTAGARVTLIAGNVCVASAP